MRITFDLTKPKGIRLASARYEHIERAAAEILIICDVNIPIDPFYIADKMGIEVISYTALSNGNNRTYNLLLKKSKYAFTATNEKHTIIYYNERQDEATIRNSIMHEIGHIDLGHKEETEVTEAEAKYFAKYICAPTCIAKICHNYGLNIGQIFGIGDEAERILLERISKTVNFLKISDHEIKLEEWFYSNTSIGLQIMNYKLQKHYKKHPQLFFNLPF